MINFSKIFFLCLTLNFYFNSCFGQTVKTDTNIVSPCLEFSLDDSISEYNHDKITMIKLNMFCCGIDQFLIDTINKKNKYSLSLSNRTIAMVVDFDEHGKVLNVNFPQHEIMKKISFQEVVLSSLTLIPNYNVYYTDYFGRLSFVKDMLFSLTFDSNSNLIKIN